MKKFYSFYVLLIFLVMSMFPAYSQVTAPNKIWDKTIGGNSSDIFRTMIAISDGGYLLGGDSNSSISGDKSENSRGIEDYWIVKIDENGNKIWDKTFGGSNEDDLFAMVSTLDGGYLLGGYSISNISGDKSENNKGDFDYWIVKIDANGNKVWDKTIGGNSSDFLSTIIPTPDGGYLLGGTSNSDISGDKSENNKGGFDYWIVKIDANGNKVWDKTIGGNTTDDCFNIISTSNGGYLLGGISISNISGDKSEDGKGNWDYWLVNIDAEGNKIWDRTLGGVNADYLETMISNADGGYLLGGSSNSNISEDKSEDSRGSDDYWIVKLDEDGNKIWDKTFGGNDTDLLLCMIYTPDGGYLLGGFSDSSISGDKSEDSRGSEDYWIVKIDENGNKVWDKTLGGSSNDWLFSMLNTPNDEYLLVGRSYSDISGDKSEDGKGEFDYWVVRLSSDIVPNKITGKIYNDINQNCVYEEGTNSLANWIVKSVSENDTFYSSTNESGNYVVYTDEGTYTITQIPPVNQAILLQQQVCPTEPYTITFEGLGKDTTGFDFANRITECSLLKVDINSNRRRRCFTNQTTVSYCNEGLVVAENVEIEVSFPQFVVPLSSTFAWESVQGSVYTFNIGTLEAGQCGSFVVTDSVLCEAGITGLTQCTEAKIYPKNNCVAPGGDWNGAELDITGNCFTQPNFYALVKIQNTGTGNMNEARQYRVFLDESLAFSASITLAAGDSLLLQIPTQGKDLRVEIDQVANHPTETLVSYQTPGNCQQSFDAEASFAAMAMAFPPADEPAEVEIDCQPIIDSFDPNDKLVHPIGFTENRYVRPGTPLEYTLRFQNTGTAEAVNIVIIDTLSADLDMTRFQMMSASHDYKLQVSGQGRPILTWIFNNINLPDSTSNEPESHGYIKFKISPNADLAEGTIIENFTDIYFDFNDPIRTNTTISNITDYQFPVAPIDFCDMVRVAEAGENQNVCEASVVLAGNVPNIGEGTWTVLGGNGTFDNPNKPNAQVSNLAVGENIFQWRITSEQCTATESTVSVFYLPVNQANAGDDQTLCTPSTSLSGNTPVNGQGKWTLLSGQAQINNPNAPNSAIQNLGYGENVFQWSIGSALCDSTHSTVRIIRLREPSTAEAGQDAIVCGETYTLQGNAPQYGTGYWTKISGSGTLINPESPQAQVTGITLGESIFEWRVSNGVCESNASQVKLTRIAPQANAVNIQADKAAICEGEEVTFTALPENAGTSPSYQWKVNGQNVGTNQASFTSTTLRANDMVTVEMQADLDCPSPATAISEALSITVYPRPAKANILHAQAKTLSASTTGLSYVWYKDEEVLEENTQSITVEELGTYRVEVVGANCTSALSDAFVLDAAALSRFADGEVVLVFPNPSDGAFTLKITNNAGSSVQVTLYDAQGKTMLTASYPESNQIDFEASLKVPVSTAGNYWMRVEYKNTSEIKKLMVR